MDLVRCTATESSSHLISHTFFLFSLALGLTPDPPVGGSYFDGNECSGYWPWGLYG